MHFRVAIAGCPEVFDRPSIIELLTSKKSDYKQYKNRNKKNLGSVAENLKKHLEKMTQFMKLNQNRASMEALLSHDFKNKTGITVNLRSAIELNIIEITILQLDHDRGNTRAVYEKFYLEEIDAMAEVPRYDAENESIELPGEIEIIVQEGDARLSLSEAIELKYISKELGELIAEMEMFTRLEELFHAADHASFSFNGQTVSASFQKLLDLLGLSFNYSTMTEVAFAFYVEFDLGLASTMFKSDANLREEFLKAYQERTILNRKDVQRAVESGGL